MRSIAITTLAATMLGALALAMGLSEVGWTLLGISVVATGYLFVLATRSDKALRDLLAVEEALRHSEEKFAGILSIAADAIITMDEQQRVIHFNWGAEQIFRYEAAEIIGRPLNALLPERYRAAHSAYVEGFAHTPETARRMGHRRAIYGLRRDGEEFPAEASISRLETGGRMLFTVVLRDVSEQTREEELGRFLAVSAAFLAGSLDLDETLDSVVEVARPTLADCCLLEVEVDGERRVLATRHDDEAMSEILADIASAGEVHERVIREQLSATAITTLPLLARDRLLGRLLLISTSRRRHAAEDPAVTESLAMSCATAIESARLYRAAQRATRMREEVLGVVSHDLRNPISAVAMCARVLAQAPPKDPAEYQRLVTAISQATDWMNRLIQDLLDVASIEAGHLSIERAPESAAEMVRSAIALLEAEASRHSVVIVADIEERLPPVNVDAERIVQVLQNLLGNAIKFSPAGAEVTISARRDPGSVRFSVRDAGVGISGTDAEHIFERYWHLRRGSASRGTGLGLAIAKGIVDAHEGRIWVESQPGLGSTFSFTVRAHA